MTNYRVVLAAAVASGLLVYGGFVGIEAAVNGTVPAAPTAGEVSVQGSTVHLDRTGRPTVVGEVANGRNGPITNVTVTVTGYRNGDRVASATQRTLRTTIPAGATAPFDVHLPTESAVDDYDVSVSFREGGDVDSALVVRNQHVESRGQDRVVVGSTVVNTGDRPRELSRVVATFYDANRSVIGARQSRPTRTLRPGESVTVSVRFRTLGDVPSYARRFDDFDLAAVANRTDA
ncbi:FxLYD domain-containing protein [Halobaculum sp. P14]|uniref:FxLYD domain-containing protein n=1 Tax=Halobaculum sp. P14 TaxID=3421638 RepID=UPI003EBF1168